MPNLIDILRDAVDDERPAARERAWKALSRLLHCYARAAMSPGDRREFESLELADSVAASLVAELRAQRVLASAEEPLRRYLQSMVRHKLLGYYRRLRAQRRGGGERPLPLRGESGVAEPEGPEASAGTLLVERELADEVDAMLGDEERRLIEAASRGDDWEAVSRRVGLSPDAARMRWKRLRDRIESLLDS